MLANMTIDSPNDGNVFLVYLDNVYFIGSCIPTIW